MNPGDPRVPWANSARPMARMPQNPQLYAQHQQQMRMAGPGRMMRPGTFPAQYGTPPAGPRMQTQVRQRSGRHPSQNDAQMMPPPSPRVGPNGRNVGKGQNSKVVSSKQKMLPPARGQDSAALEAVAPLVVAPTTPAEEVTLQASADLQMEDQTTSERTVEPCVDSPSADLTSITPVVVTPASVEPATSQSSTALQTPGEMDHESGDSNHAEMASIPKIDSPNIMLHGDKEPPLQLLASDTDSDEGGNGRSSGDVMVIECTKHMSDDSGDEDMPELDAILKQTDDNPSDNVEASLQQKTNLRKTPQASPVHETSPPTLQVFDNTPVAHDSVQNNRVVNGSPKKPIDKIDEVACDQPLPVQHKDGPNRKRKVLRRGTAKRGRSKVSIHSAVSRIHSLNDSRLTFQSSVQQKTSQSTSPQLSFQQKEDQSQALQFSSKPSKAQSPQASSHQIVDQSQGQMTSVLENEERVKLINSPQHSQKPGVARTQQVARRGKGKAMLQRAGKMAPAPQSIASTSPQLSFQQKDKSQVLQSSSKPKSKISQSQAPQASSQFQQTAGQSQGQMTSVLKKEENVEPMNCPKPFRNTVARTQQVARRGNGKAMLQCVGKMAPASQSTALSLDERSYATQSLIKRVSMSHTLKPSPRRPSKMIERDFVSNTPKPSTWQLLNAPFSELKISLQHPDDRSFPQQSCLQRIRDDLVKSPKVTLQRLAPETIAGHVQPARAVTSEQTIPVEAAPVPKKGRGRPAKRKSSVSPHTRGKNKWVDKEDTSDSEEDLDRTPSPRPKRRSTRIIQKPKSYVDPCIEEDEEPGEELLKPTNSANADNINNGHGTHEEHARHQSSQESTLPHIDSFLDKPHPSPPKQEDPGGQIAAGAAPPVKLDPMEEDDAETPVRMVTLAVNYAEEEDDDDETPVQFGGVYPVTAPFIAD